MAARAVSEVNVKHEEVKHEEVLPLQPAARKATRRPRIVDDDDEVQPAKKPARAGRKPRISDTPSTAAGEAAETPRASRAVSRAASVVPSPAAPSPAAAAAAQDESKAEDAPEAQDAADGDNAQAADAAPLSSPHLAPPSAQPRQLRTPSPTPNATVTPEHPPLERPPTQDGEMARPTSAQTPNTHDPIVLKSRANMLLSQPEVPEGPKERLVITHLVMTNFKSYAGRQEVGPFHPVSTYATTNASCFLDGY